MPNIIYEYVNEDGAIIHIHAEDPNPRPVTRGRRDKEESVTKKIQMKFEDALGTVTAAASGLKKVIDKVNPSEASVEFSLKSEVEAGIFTICRATAAAEFKITLTWKKENTNKTPLT